MRCIGVEPPCVDHQTLPSVRVADRLATLPAYQAIMEVRGRYALLDVRLSGQVTALADTNERLRPNPPPHQISGDSA